jgi:hypothetical protein
LLVYEPNQFFLKHQDTEKSDDMIGTLVVTLPSTYGGGDLMVGQGEEWKAYRGSRNALSLVAFYAACQHEVLKIKSGYRVILTYNLLLHGDTTPRPEGDAGTIEELADLLREHFTTPATPSWGGQPANPPSRLVYLLDHEYTPRALAWSRLKGADAPGYLLQSRVGPQAEVTFLRSFGGNGFHVTEVEDGDLPRIAELVEKYVSLPPRHCRRGRDRDRRATRPHGGRGRTPARIRQIGLDLFHDWSRL